MDGREFLRIRKALGLTQERLAAELGVHKHSLVKWERGERGISDRVAETMQRLEKETTGPNRRALSEFVASAEALSRPGGGGVIGVPSQLVREGSIKALGREWKFFYYEFPGGGVPSGGYCFPEVRTPGDLEAVRAALLKQTQGVLARETSRVLLLEEVARTDKDAAELLAAIFDASTAGLAASYAATDSGGLRIGGRGKAARQAAATHEAIVRGAREFDVRFPGLIPDGASAVDVVLSYLGVPTKPTKRRHRRAR